MTSPKCSKFKLTIKKLSITKSIGFFYFIKKAYNNIIKPELSIVSTVNFILLIKYFNLGYKYCEDTLSVLGNRIYVLWYILIY